MGKGQEGGIILQMWRGFERGGGGSGGGNRPLYAHTIRAPESGPVLIMS
jgi:hypothetical protein